jgi:Raf kinase inhibitor-like YbhB/YbcL family protein
MSLGTLLHSNRKIIRTLAFVCAFAFTFIAIGSVMTPPETHRKMTLTSTAFQDGQAIPGQYTCDDKNISPPLAWSGAPANTSSFVLIVDDPDAAARVWTHWILFNVPGSASNLPEDAAKDKNFPSQAHQGLNDFKHSAYNGPCPPTGQRHRYFFHIYALDISLNLPEGTSKQAVESAMAKHVLAQGQLVGTYQRK